MNAKDKARYYDIISDPGKRLAHEGQFLLWLLERAPGGRVVDTACGTGVQAEFLARHGAVVTARDIDRDMIEYACERRPHRGVTYEVADMTKASGGPFDLAICMGNSLSMLPSGDAVATAVGLMGGTLAPGGVAFLHVLNYAAVTSRPPAQKVARQRSDSGEIVVVKDMVPAEGAGLLVSFSYFERRGSVWHTAGEQAALLDLKRDWLVAAGEKAGLSLEGEFGDYDSRPFEAESSVDLLLVFRKDR
jgi:SAM-dependent methyltransferase